MVHPSNLSYLIVDDVSSIREFLRQTLIQMGATQISEASNGQAAIKQYQAKQPDVIFMDIDLPDTTGHKVLESIKTITPNFFVIMISAHSTAENVRTSIKNGAAGFIVKPFSPQKISVILKKFQA